MEEGEFEIGSEQKVSIQSLSSFLYDLNLLHDCLALSTISDYEDFNFTQFFYYRQGRPLKKEHTLYLNSINHNSPLSLEVIIPLAASAAGIPWLLLQSFQKIKNWKLDRRKLEIEVENAELDLQEKRARVANEQLNLEERLQSRESLSTFENVISRIERYPFFAVDVDMEMSNMYDQDENNQSPPPNLDNQ